LLALLAVTPLMAQQAPAPTTPPAAPVAPAPAPAPAADAATVVGATPATSVTKSKDTLSVDFPDEEIRTILRNVADLFELNLVIPDTLQGRTSLKLRDVSWRQIFQVVLSPVGYSFVEDGNIIKIVSNESLTQEPVSTEVFIINYAKAEEIRKSVEPLVDAAAGGKVLVDARSNALVITERPSRMGRIRPIVEKLDKATEQVMIESKFVELSDTDTLAMGLDWAVSGGVDANAASQASLDAVSRNTSHTVGSWNYATSVLSSIELKSTLDWLKTRANGKLVNNPTVVTLNNTEAFINIGQEYPIPSYTYNSQTGSFAVSGFEYKPIGTILKVTPQINSQGFIKLTLEPEISSTTSSVTFDTASIPIIDTRKTKSQVSLKDGNTLGIGGLIRDEQTKAKRSLPVLGSIPFLGKLFQHDSTTQTRTNLLIFITAKIVSSENATVTDVFDPRAIRSAQLKRSDLPGFRPQGDPFLPEVAPVDPNAPKAPKAK
jgi:type IV pilus assembly protein PilQ